MSDCDAGSPAEFSSAWRRTLDCANGCHRRVGRPPAWRVHRKALALLLAFVSALGFGSPAEAQTPTVELGLTAPVCEGWSSLPRGILTLDGAPILLRLTGAEFEDPPDADHFGITTSPALPSGASLAVDAAGSHHIWDLSLTLSFTGNLTEDINLGVTIDGAAYGGETTITTPNELPVFVALDSHPPTELHTNWVRSDEILLRWIPSFFPCVRRANLVHESEFRLSGEGNLWGGRAPPAEPADQGRWFRDLASGTSYDFRARACLRGADPEDCSNWSPTFTVATLESSNADLSALAIAPGALNESFSADRTSYTATVANDVESVKVTPMAAHAAATVTVDGAAVGSGQPSGDIALAVGVNSIAVRVTAQDGTTKTYTVRVTRRAAASSNADLSALSIAPGTLNESFQADRTSYTATVAHGTASVRVTPRAAHAAATVRVDGAVVARGQPSGAIALAVGANSIAVEVTAEDGTTKTYAIGVTREAASSNADLSGLAIAPGALNETFRADRTSYTATVANDAASVRVTPTAADAAATVRVDGAVVARGQPSAAIALVVGGNRVAVEVTAEDGTRKTYLIDVTRQAPPGTPTASLALSASAIAESGPGNAATLTATLDEAAPATATVEVSADPAGAVTLGATTLTIPAGDTASSGAITVTAVNDGLDTGDTTVTLSATVPSGIAAPAAVGLAIAEDDRVPGVVAAPRLESATATSLTVSWDAPADAGEVDGRATALTGYDVLVREAFGGAARRVPFAGTGTRAEIAGLQPGTAYRIRVAAENAAGRGGHSAELAARTLSDEAGLSALSIAPGTLSPPFRPGTTAYAATVANDVSSVEVRPTAESATAGVTVNGTPVPSGTVRTVSLAVGANRIEVVVTAETGASRTYTVDVTRERLPGTPTASLSLSSATIAESGAGNAATLTATLDEAASGAATLTVAADPAGAVTLGGTTLTIPAGATASSGGITVTAVNDAEDAGDTAVTLSATASAGVVAPAAVRLTVADDDEAPGAVEAPRLEAATATSLTVSWDPPAETGEVDGDPTAVTGYEVLVGRAGGAERRVPFAGTGTRVEIAREGGADDPPLEPDTAYRIRVAAANAAGRGPPSAALAASTLSNNAALSALAIEPGTLSPPFRPDTLAYAATVDYEAASVTVAPTAADARAVVAVDGTPVAAGGGAVVALDVGANDVAVRVEAPDGTVRTYTVAVTRNPPPSPTAPDGLRVAERTRTLVGIVWRASVWHGPGTVTYASERRLAGGDAWLDAESGRAGTERTFAGLVGGTGYEFRVRGCVAEEGGDNCGDWSAILAAATLDVTAAVSSTDPPLLNAANVDGATLTVDLDGADWAADPGADEVAVTGLPGLTVAAVTRAGTPTRAVVALAFDGRDFAEDATLGLAIAAAAHAGGNAVAVADAARVSACGTADATPVAIPDAALRGAVGRILGKAEGDAVSRADLSAVRRLSAGAAGVADLSGLEHAICLVELALWNSRVSDLAPLADLDTLAKLDLRGNDVADLAPVAGLGGLRTLWLAYNDIADLSPLAGLTALESLSLSRNGIADLSPLAGLTGLTALYLSRNRIADVAALSGMAGLRTLYLSENAVADPGPLADLARLRTLQLGDNRIARIDALAGLARISRLDISGNDIADLAPLRANAGLGRGDTVDVNRNPLGRTSIHDHMQALADRGVAFPIDIPDAGLRGRVLAALDRPARARVDFDDLRGLGALAAGGVLPPVRNLTGLQFAVALGDLELDDNDIADLAPLAGLDGLARLRLDDNDVADLAPLGDLAGLADLGASRNRIEDLAPLAGLTALAVLRLDGNRIADLAPLAGLPELADLRLAANDVADLSPLAGLATLTSLGLSHNDIADVAPLAGLTGLASLSLQGNDVADASPLAALVRLEALHLGGNDIADAAPLADLAMLTSLRLEGNRIADAAPLAALTALTDLRLGDAVADLGPLAGLASLTGLHVSGPGTADLSALAALPALAELRLGGAVADVGPLAGLAALTDLSVPDNGVADVSPLAGLDGLVSLDLSGNAVADVVPLAGLAALKRLRLAGNPVADASPLAELTGLETLNLAGTGTADLSPLAGLAGLRSLAVRGNAVADLAPLAGLSALGSLWASDNGIADLTALSGLEGLDVLALADNAIVDVAPLVANAGLADGDFVDLSGNPLASEDGVAALRARGVEVVADGEPARSPLLRVARGRVLGDTACAATSGVAGAVRYSLGSWRWQSRPDAEGVWADIPGTAGSAAGGDLLCPYRPAGEGEFRLVAAMSVDGVPGTYVSNTIRQ